MYEFLLQRMAVPFIIVLGILKKPVSDLPEHFLPHRKWAVLDHEGTKNLFGYYEFSS